MKTRLHAAGFTLIELLTVIGIIALLAAIAFPILSKMQESGRSAQNMANLRQIHVALRAFAQDNDNCLPPVASDANTVWDRDNLAPYLPKRSDGRQNAIFIGPNAKYKGFETKDISRAYSATECMLGIEPDTGAVSFNFRLLRNLNSIVDPVKSPLVFDGAQNGNLRYSAEEVKWVQLTGAGDLKPPAAASFIDFRNQGDAHFLYVDGHVAGMNRTEAAAQLTSKAWQGIQ